MGTHGDEKVSPRPRPKYIPRNWEYQDVPRSTSEFHKVPRFNWKYLRVSGCTWDYLGVPEPYQACMRVPRVHASTYRTQEYIAVPGAYLGIPYLEVPGPYLGLPGSTWAYQGELGPNLGVPMTIWAYQSYKLGIRRSYTSVPEHT